MWARQKYAREKEKSTALTAPCEYNVNLQQKEHSYGYYCCRSIPLISPKNGEKRENVGVSSSLKAYVHCWQNNKKYVWEPLLFPRALSKVHRTRQWAGDLVQGSWQQCRLTHCTVRAVARGYDNTLWQEFWTCRAHKGWTAKNRSCGCLELSGELSFNLKNIWLESLKIWCIILNHCRCCRCIWIKKKKKVIISSAH